MKSMKSMKRMKRIFIIFGLCLLATVAFSVSTFAAKKPKLNKKKATIYVGKTLQLKVKNAKGKKVKWKSSNKKVATVSKKGKVRGKKPGKATITATIGKKKLKCRVTVKTKYTNKTASNSTNKTVTLTSDTNSFRVSGGSLQASFWITYTGSDSLVLSAPSNGVVMCDFGSDYGNRKEIIVNARHNGNTELTIFEEHGSKSIKIPITVSGLPLLKNYDWLKDVMISKGGINSSGKPNISTSEYLDDGSLMAGSISYSETDGSYKFSFVLEDDTTRSGMSMTISEADISNGYAHAEYLMVYESGSTKGGLKSTATIKMSTFNGSDIYFDVLTNILLSGSSSSQFAESTVQNLSNSCLRAALSLWGELANNEASLSIQQLGFTRYPR